MTHARTIEGLKQAPSEDIVNRPSHYAPNGRDSFMHMKDQMGKKINAGLA